jgi:hypothetical protein
MAAFYFSPAQAAANMAEGQQASVPIQSLLMQIDADAVCLVRTQFQQIIRNWPFNQPGVDPAVNRDMLELIEFECGV